ncbi:hypothetical protein [Azohydromonas australica]|uniref:hypothetical protein n=1 Tax=Azohydromonas australica TaxID=364039 RepID=UPI000413C800|nr:hypothetical protein [Azohydromonas australica]
MNPSPTRRRFALGLAAAALALQAAFALAAPPSGDAAFDAAWQSLDRAMDGGDSAASDAAAEKFAALSQADPANPVLLAYAGAAQALKGRDAWAPWRKLSLTEEGLARIDKALALLQPAHDRPLYRGTPASLETRYVAASVFLGLPPMFKRGPRGEQLLADVLGSPLLAASPAGFQGAVLMYAGRQAVKAGKPAEARRHFEAVLARNAPQAATARQALQGLSS